ncbi:MAG TPA: RsmE family RNA methyltransferase [Candidatus Paceibacterota bacterium]|jgi:16S rRNA (uracil1498-N3)-methyltransferase|nr:RsmE family RNA methyltransferase [Candidatus Paceibacterota bacterium]HOH11143.1 RsmE family RNA methyltransferase [Candidatus Paceibacterota bacterium]HOY11156.1 RsmE family RNA methyltransferase [Candidatus Paceibacterota bacterium]HPB60649.1 RsmE family RNA methyltransferase [Candidatus Paceibacterota bacterium]HPI24327.1 RsmE family RNA methyltransferase [Candidatus Paceibacterota bacterium]
MRKDRFFIPTDYSGEFLVWRDRELAHQLKNVLRLDGDKVVFLFNGRGEEATVSLAEIKDEDLRFKILSVQSAKELGNKITLYVSLLKRDNFEFVVQKATEAGVLAIVPIVAARTVKQGDKTERWQIIAKEAAEQSGRLIVPKVCEALSFDEAIRVAAESHELNILFDLNGAKLKKVDGNIGIFVGPEGGFSPAEIGLAQEKGFSKFSLGDFTLRAETAAIIGTFVISGGWRP